ncbi:hypothetical protein ACMS05_003489 [Cronobacter turicensis]|uniref:Uncharacterized protein n=2 Tax=Cronobacter turicensis TaxID=413502 RepID=A0ACD5ISX0_9ENTR|nr:hypothetical protein [Cronobacter turicensis]MDI7419838.1 hypothetical protein [Cronobacter turicensis]MDI7498647.1 hypothetical protein [Cronobacter turicensis]
MVNTAEIKGFIKSDNYTYLLNSIVLELNVEINKSEPPSQVLNLDANRIKNADVSLKELEEVIVDDCVNIIKYVRIKMFGLDEEDIDDYNEEQDKDVIIEKLPFYKNFLITYMIEYYLLKNNQVKLEDYLKKSKIPKHKQYAEELKSFYNKI